MHFLKSLEEIEAINSQENITYEVGVNLFADWTDAEKASLTGLVLPQENDNSEHVLLDESAISNGVDWRSKLPAIKN